VRCAGLQTAYVAPVKKCRIFLADLSLRMGTMLLRATHSPVACVHWVKHGT
jgi:hypothetical protein